MTENIERIKATAHHEAGHAVLAWHLGLGFESVTVEAAGTYSGRVTPVEDSLLADDKRALNPEECVRLEKYISTSIGGPVANAVYSDWDAIQQRPDELMSIVWDYPGANVDFANTMRHTKQLVDSQSGNKGAGAELQRQTILVRKAFDLVNRNGILWPAVRSLANALVNKGTLGYKEAAEVMAAP